MIWKNKIKVLLIEDSPSDVELIKIELEKCEFDLDISLVNNEETFLNAINTFKIDFIISDYVLPDFTGLDALKYLRQDHPFVPFILITNSLGEEKAVEIILAGANDFLLKENLHNLQAAMLRALHFSKEQEDHQKVLNLQRESEIKFRGLIENSHDFILVSDINNKITYASPAFLVSLGKSANDIYNHSIDLFIHKEDVAKNEEGIHKLKEESNNSTNIKLRWILNNGGLRWMEATISDKRKIPGIQGIVYNIRDIHDYITSQEDLLKSNVLLDAVMNNLNEGVVVVSSDNSLVMANEAARKMLGINNDKGLYKKWGDLVSFYDSPGSDKLTIEEMPSTLASNGENINDRELYMKNVIDNNGIYININARPLIFGDGNIQGGLISFTDITEKRMYQMELIKTLELLEHKVKERTIQLQKSNDELKFANKQITYSINYAQRIQNAVTVKESDLSKDIFSSSFLLNIPKDIVSGDFVWMHSANSFNVLAVADCTGHGVPGALLTMLGNQLLERIVIDRQISRPEIILEELNISISRLMKSNDNENMMNDGMDISICLFDREQNKMSFSGANNNGLLVKNDKLITLEADRCSIGGYWKSSRKEFTRNTFDITKGDRIYLMSDGFQDQFGGEFDKKFTKKRLIQFISDIQADSMKVQKNKLNDIFQEWKKNELQIDDVIVLGIEY